MKRYGVVGPEKSFWSLREMTQPVNQWLCIAFLGVWCFWILLFYVTKKSEVLGENISPSVAALYQN